MNQHQVKSFKLPSCHMKYINKENSGQLQCCSLEGMMLKLKLQYFGHLMWRVDSLEKTDAGRDWGQEEKGTTEDEMAGWHHWLDGCESGWTPGVGDGQGSLACCDSWGRKESGTTERLNWTELTDSACCPEFSFQSVWPEALSRNGTMYYIFLSCM